MKHLSNRYGVYRHSNGQYMLSTMTAGIRNLDHRVPRPRNKRKRITMAAIKKACCRYRPLFFIAAVLSATQGFMALMLLSVFLLSLSLSRRKKVVKDSK